MLQKSSLLFFMLALWSMPLYSQCCSPGNPVGGTSNVGTTQENNLRLATFFRHSYSDTYYEGSHKAEFQGTTANFNYLGCMAAYGITSRLTIETEFGFFINKTRISDFSPKENGWGFSNGLASLKYALWKDKINEWELTAGAGIRFPFTRELKTSEDGYPLSMDVQPSTGTTGFVGHFFLYKGFLAKKWRLFLLDRFETNAVNDIGYQYGKANYTAFFVSHNLNLHWTAILQLRNEWRDYDHSEEIKFINTGGNVLYLAPQINYNLAQKWNISLLAEIPIARDYHLAQLGSKYSISLNFIREFDLSKKNSDLKVQ